MGLDFAFEDGQTPLDEEEKEGLKIKSIVSRGDLDEYEQQNIEKAIQWSMMRSFKPMQVFSADFICNVHKRMYADVWAWAGDFRKTNKNIGVDYWKIPSELKTLIDDTNFWFSNNTFEPDEIAIRFKHRVVSIHCFANGNGRHSRLMADIIIEKLFKRPVFSWGTGLYPNSNLARTAYISAIREADSGNIKPLLDFARS
jgi:Fic-DOC domain mobile mystery protein B